MTHKQLLVGTSLASVLLLSLHLAQDALYARAGTTAAGAGNITAILILLLLLAGPALLADRRSGMGIMLLLALFAAGMPILHFNLGTNWSRVSDALFFVWCLIALGVNGFFSLILWIAEVRRLRIERRVAP